MKNTYNAIFYKLNDDNTVSTVSASEWGLAMDTRRHVAKATVNGCFISTVFLGIDHNFHSGGKPIFFETMIFTKRKGSYKKLDQRMRRYCTYNEAEAAHHEIVKAVKHKQLTKLSSVVY